MPEKTYVAIDLKSFYASAECISRGIDPLTANLVVADPSRTEKTICLAVSPSLKALGIPGRPRLFEVVEQVKLINAKRLEKAPGHCFTGSSWDARELEENPGLALDYIVAPPRMAYYMEHSANIYNVYLHHVAPQDIHVYSIDEVFLDVTPYLRSSGLTAYAFTRRILQDVLKASGITATAGIGTNLYLCKVAMDIVAKHIPPDDQGVRIAQLDEAAYRSLLWDHRPITDFWRVGRGYARRLEKVGLYTMGDIARCSVGSPNSYYNEDLLYKIFGVNAELLIDHAWGWEPCTLAHIKAYRPSTNSISTGQVLSEPYTWEKAKLIVREMADLLSLDLVEKGLVTQQLTLTVGYDTANFSIPSIADNYKGEVTLDHYGRKVPRHGHGTQRLCRPTSSTMLIVQAMAELFDRITDPALLVRRLTLAACDVVPESRIPEEAPQQLDLFGESEAQRQREEALTATLEKEKRRQKAVLQIKRRYGKNAILKGMNLSEGATAKDRNSQIGGHKA